MNERSDNPHAFPPTQWSLILSAQANESEIRARALEQICSRYWHPVYAYARGRGLKPPDAQDLTQGFFAHLLSTGGLRSVSEAKGKLRSFLLVAVRNFLTNEWIKMNRQRRGGGATVLSFDWEDAEKRTALEPVDHVTPEVIFERHWALTLLRAAMERLESYYREKNKERLFDQIGGFLDSREGMPSSRELGEALDMSPAAVDQAVYEMRKRYRGILLREVAATLEEGERAEDELRYLLGVFGG